MSGNPVASPPVLTWRVLPVRTPHVVRPCPRCNAERPFASSDRFRVNASGRRLDVWLIYRCVSCDFTWNLTVVERATPESIGGARLRAFQMNDPCAAWSCAFDGALLARAGARPEGSTPVAVERAPLLAGWVTVRLAVPLPVRVRLDRLVARELGIPRSRIRAHVESGRELRRPVFDGQVIRLLGHDEVPDLEAVTPRSAREPPSRDRPDP